MIVFTGTVALDPAAPSPIKHKEYFKKYRQGIANIGMTPQKFREQDLAAIRVTPKTLRGF